MPENLSGDASVRELVASVAGPRSWSDTRESWLARAARRAGISYRQAKALWYGEITDPFHRSATLMRIAADRYERLCERIERDADRRMRPPRETDQSDRQMDLGATAATTEIDR